MSEEPVRLRASQASGPRVYITGAPAPTDQEFGPTQPGSHPGESSARLLHTGDILRILFVALAGAAVLTRLWEPIPSFSVVGVAGTIVGTYPILREAFDALLQRRMTMELSMCIAICAALAIGEVFTALVIVLFVLIAEELERLTVGRGRRAIGDLLDLVPETVLVRRDGRPVEVSADQIVPGDVIVVKPGVRVPVDGAVCKGSSFVDESAITGESLPVEKTAGMPVYASSINQSGTIDVTVARVGRETAFGKIVQAVEEAEKSRAPIQKTADRLAGYLVYFAAGCAILTFAIGHDPRSTISVIIVAGACGVAAGTPLAILGAIGQAARRGAIVKGGRYLEELGRIDVVVMDKTGTLTCGDTTVVGLHPVSGVSEQSLLLTAAVAERSSEHPLGRAILKRLAEQGLTAPEPDRSYYIPGKGIVCLSNGDEILVGSQSLLKEWRIDTSANGSPASVPGSEVLVARRKAFLGSIQIGDVPRPEALQAIGELRRMGLRTVLLTGDNEDVAGAISATLGIDRFVAGMLPDEKSFQIRVLKYTGAKIAMVGDGINDAPALVEAQVGIAMGSGTDIAKEGAGVVLIGNDLLKLVDLIKVARRCRRVIIFNFAGTLVVDGIGVGLAAFGLLNPLLAAFIHVSSELAFILNSSRLLPRPELKW